MQLHFAEEGQWTQCQEEREGGREGGPEGKGRGDEEIMGVAGLVRAVIVWEFESATSIISHSGNGQNKGNISCCYGLKCAFNRIEISYAM